jgi:predicted PurR-regulated permease PerM
MAFFWLFKRLIMQNTTHTSQHWPAQSHWALKMLGFFLIIYMLNWAESFFVTVFLGVLLSYLLNPIVTMIERYLKHRLIATLLVMLSFLGAVVASGYVLSNQFDAIINQAQEVSEKWSDYISEQKNDRNSNFHKLEQAAKRVEETAEMADKTNTAKRPLNVVFHQETFKISDYMWKGSLGLFGILGSFATVMLMSFFLLSSGDMVKRKLVKLLGSDFAEKKITVQIIQDINNTIQKYINMLFITNALLGVFVWVAIKIIGIHNATGWAIAAAIIHFIPYFGPLIISALLSVSAYLQFGDLSMALVTMVVVMTINTLVGVMITTWMTGRFAQMNSLVIFSSLIFFAWLWGVAGMLLAIPIVIVIKVIADHLEQFSYLSEILGK